MIITVYLNRNHHKRRLGTACQRSHRESERSWREIQEKDDWCGGMLNTGTPVWIHLPVKACLCGEKLSLAGGSPSIPSHRRRENFSYISLAANRLHEKSQSWLGGQGDPGWRVTRFEGRVTLGYKHLWLFLPHLPGTCWDIQSEHARTREG